MLLMLCECICDHTDTPWASFDPQVFCVLVPLASSYMGNHPLRMITPFCHNTFTVIFWLCFSALQVSLLQDLGPLNRRFLLSVDIYACTKVCTSRDFFTWHFDCFQDGGMCMCTSKAVNFIPVSWLKKEGLLKCSQMALVWHTGQQVSVQRGNIWEAKRNGNGAFK